MVGWSPAKAAGFPSGSGQQAARALDREHGEGEEGWDHRLGEPQRGGGDGSRGRGRESLGKVGKHIAGQNPSEPNSEGMDREEKSFRERDVGGRDRGWRSGTWGQGDEEASDFTRQKSSQPCYSSHPMPQNLYPVLGSQSSLPSPSPWFSQDRLSALTCSVAQRPRVISQHRMGSDSHRGEGVLSSLQAA